MAPKKTRNPTNNDLLTEIQSVKGMVASQGKTLKQHSDDIAGLKEVNTQKTIAEKAAKAAVEEYKRGERERADKLPDTQWLTKELLSVIIKLIAVVAALIALWKVGGTGLK
jgi:capsule polysaccharide export protein KpsE/RkpR